MDYAKEFSKLLSTFLPDTGIGENEIYEAVETPPDPAMGHLAFPCFRLAKAFRQSPQQIAGELAEKISHVTPEAGKPRWLDCARSAGAYVNVFLNRAAFAEETLRAVLGGGEEYGASDRGGGKTVLVEFSSPNIAKHFHVGHLGSTMIGNALSNIHRRLGYNVISINYLGDWGTQFGKLITAFKKWGDREEIERTGLDGLTRIYVKFHDEADADDSLNEEARSWVVKMQRGDEEGLSLWRWFYDLSMREYNRIYERLGVNFDVILRESDYSAQMEDVARELAEKKLLVESDGAMIVDLEPYGMPPCLILRRDGGTLYPTRDVASAISRYESYHFHKSLYVTANEQILHFAQWMKVVELMGYPWAKDMAHIPYGLYSFESGKMSTRRGQVIRIDELLGEAVEKTLAIIREKTPDLPDKEEVAEQVGIGAVIFNKLYTSRIKDVVFSWERMLNFEGETGPYVQYTHARACSLLERAGYDAGGASGLAPSGGALTEDEAFDVLRLLYDYPAKIAEAAEKYEPFLIARHLVAVAQAFNKFYHAHTVIVDEPVLRGARLALTDAVRAVLRGGLALLGVRSPQRM